jgi:hypothetical protein
MDNPVKRWYSRTLNITSEPEEKRKIIGDTFIQVLHGLNVLPFFLGASGRKFLLSSI